MNAAPDPLKMKTVTSLTRRAFLQQGALVMTGALLSSSSHQIFAGPKEVPLFQVGLLTDIHYADIPTKGMRSYRESLPKIRECVSKFNEAGVAFAIEVGDLIDAGDTVEKEIGHLKTVNAEYAKFNGKRHYVLGNHCVFSLTKDEFYANSGAKQSPYSFDHDDFHFVILDACHRPDGVPYGRKNFKWNEAEIPHAQREWLKADLKATNKQTIAFVHQRLDVEKNYGIKSGPQVRSILEQSGKVLAVFQGHSHKNDYQQINSIHYCTLAAMIEGNGESNNAYGLLSVFNGGTLKMEGFRQQKSYEFRQKG